MQKLLDILPVHSTAFNNLCARFKTIGVTWMFAFILSSVCWASTVEDLGIVGKTYPVIEQDALSVMQQNAGKVDWRAYFSQKGEQYLKQYRPSDLADLNVAKAPHVYTVDLTYTLEMDIPDGKGGILYPRGYTFNPLDYLNYPATIVVIDGNDEAQIRWFEDCAFNDKYSTRLLISQGSYVDLSRRLKRQVYYLSKIVAERFKITATPSVVCQKGNMMEVTQIAVD